MNTTEAVAEIITAQAHLARATELLTEVPEPEPQRMQLGASVHRDGMPNVRAFQEHQTVVSGRLQIRGTYDPGAPMWAQHDASDDDGLGVDSWLCVKTLDPDVAAEVVQSVPINRRPHTIVTVWHEPEDQVQAGFFTIPQWVAVQEAVAAAGHALGVRTAAVLMAWTFNSRSSRDPDGYAPGVVVHPLVGLNGYDRKRAEVVPLDVVPRRRHFADVFQPAVDTVRLWGVDDWAVRETGTHAADRPAWWREAVQTAATQGCRIFMPWDSTRKLNFALSREERLTIADAIDALP